MIKPTEKQFNVTIPDIGIFTFRYTNLRDELAIDNIANDFLKGNINPGVGAINIATMMASIKVAMVKGPDEFKLDDLYSYDDLKAVYDAYSEKVSQFRFRTKDQTGGVGAKPKL